MAEMPGIRCGKKQCLRPHRRQDCPAAHSLGTMQWAMCRRMPRGAIAIIYLHQVATQKGKPFQLQHPCTVPIWPTVTPLASADARSIHAFMDFS